MENPSTNRFREEFKSMNCRLERPTAVIIPGEKSIRRVPLSSPAACCQALLEAEDRFPDVLSLSIRNQLGDQCSGRKIRFGARMIPI